MEVDASFGAPLTWVLGSFGEWAAWFVVGGGGLLAVCIAAMSVVVLLDCWMRVPVIGRIPADRW